MAHSGSRAGIPRAASTDDDKIVFHIEKIRPPLRVAAGGFYILGIVMPRWPMYFPARSA